jgi:hypothetical protein
LPAFANQLCDKKRDIAGAAADVDHAHPRDDAGAARGASLAGLPWVPRKPVLLVVKAMLCAAY